MAKLHIANTVFQETSNSGNSRPHMDPTVQAVDLLFHSASTVGSIASVTQRLEANKKHKSLILLRVALRQISIEKWSTICFIWFKYSIP